jgi:hypothetical protein
MAPLTTAGASHTATRVAASFFDDGDVRASCVVTLNKSRNARRIRSHFWRTHSFQDKNALLNNHICNFHAAFAF